MTVAELERRMDMDEFLEWIEYYEAPIREQAEAQKRQGIENVKTLLRSAGRADT